MARAPQDMKGLYSNEAWRVPSSRATPGRADARLLARETVRKWRVRFMEGRMNDDRAGPSRPTASSASPLTAASPSSSLPNPGRWPDINMRFTKRFELPSASVAGQRAIVWQTLLGICQLPNRLICACADHHLRGWVSRADSPICNCSNEQQCSIGHATQLRRAPSFSDFRAEGSAHPRARPDHREVTAVQRRHIG
jgi:hypothetical protein